MKRKEKQRWTNGCYKTDGNYYGLPIIGEYPFGQNKPPLLVSLEVVCPLQQPTLHVRFRLRGNRPCGRGIGRRQPCFPWRQHFRHYHCLVNPTTALWRFFRAISLYFHPVPPGEQTRIPAKTPFQKSLLSKKPPQYDSVFSKFPKYLTINTCIHHRFTKNSPLNQPRPTSTIFSRRKTNEMWKMYLTAPFQLLMFFFRSASASHSHHTHHHHIQERMT